MSLFENFILTFIPLFVVVDAFGTLPLLVVLTEGMTGSERHRVVNIAMATATLVGFVFLFFGQLVLTAMGISVPSFAIAGGLILFVLSLKYIITGHIIEGAVKEELIGVVPIGTPLVTGPATITTLLLLVTQQFPLYMITISFLLNMVLSWIIFMLSSQVVRFLGRGGLRAVSNVFNLLLAAIGINMIIKGLSLLGLVKL